MIPNAFLAATDVMVEYAEAFASGQVRRFR
jgi:hypothetical protein